MSEKDLKKRGHGSFDYQTDYNTETHLLKWLDKKCCCWVKFCRSRMHQHSQKTRLGTEEQGQDRLS